MESRKIQSKKRYFYAFIISTIVFILIFVLAQGLSYLEFFKIASFQETSSYDIFTNKLIYSFFDEETCSNFSFRKVSEDLNFQGKIIDDLENKLGKDNEQILLKKKFYTLIQIEHFEFLNYAKKNCNLTKNTILFFYSNKKSLIDDSGELGRLLSFLHKRKDNLIIYSFDFDLDSVLIDKLKEKYKVEKPLTIVINEEIILYNPKQISILEGSLN